jgi:hypothetical protein
MEACSPIVARHTGGATDCEYEVAWANTYAVRIDYTATADRAGNAVYNRHRAPASRLLRVLEAVPNLRAASFRHSAPEIGVEKLATLATSTTAATTLAGLCFNGLDGITATARGLLFDANCGMAFVVDTSSEGVRAGALARRRRRWRAALRAVSHPALWTIGRLMRRA